MIGHVLQLASSVGATDDAYGVMLAALNVVQTVALAYLAARSHVDHRPRDRKRPDDRVG